MGPSDTLPPWSFVPGHRPHPRRHPEGHSYGAPEPVVSPPIRRSDPAIARGEALFDQGYYWEAHEVFEAVWIAAGRKGPAADVARSIVQLAAAGVKLRQGVTAGASRLAISARDRLAAVASERAIVLEYDVPTLVVFAESVVSRSAGPVGDPGADVESLFGPAPWAGATNPST